MSSRYPMSLIVVGRPGGHLHPTKVPTVLSISQGSVFVRRTRPPRIVRVGRKSPIPHPVPSSRSGVVIHLRHVLLAYRLNDYTPGLFFRFHRSVIIVRSAARKSRTPIRATPSGAPGSPLVRRLCQGLVPPSVGLIPDRFPPFRSNAVCLRTIHGRPTPRLPKVPRLQYLRVSCDHRPALPHTCFTSLERTGSSFSRRGRTKHAPFRICQ